MPPSRITLVTWTIALSSVTGFIVGSVSHVPSGVSSFGFTLAVVVSTSSVFGVLLWRRWDRWEGIGPYVAFSVYFTTLFIVTGTIGSVIAIALGSAGWLVTVLQMVAAAAGISLAVWLCFYDGVRDVVTWVAPRLDLDI